MDDALSVISASTDNIEIMHQVITQAAQREGVSVSEVTPDAWLQQFYAARKGSRSKSETKATSEHGLAKQV